MPRNHLPILFLGIIQTSSSYIKWSLKLGFWWALKVTQGMSRPPPEANLTVRGSEHCNLWPWFILETPHYSDKQYNLLSLLSCPCGVYLWRNFNKKSGLWSIRVIYRAAKGINRLQDKRQRKHDAAEDTTPTAVLAIKPCYLFKRMTCGELVHAKKNTKNKTSRT